MLKKVFIASLMGLVLCTGVKSVKANTVIENIAQNNTFVVGTPINAVPYSYINSSEQLDGYSIDVVKLIHQQLEKQLGKTITLSFVPINSIEETIPKIQSGEIDIACNVVFTWERDKYVDYTLRYTLSGIRLLLPKGKATNSFAGKKIGIPSQTFVKDVVKLANPDATLVEFDSMEEGSKALTEGKIDALAGDTLLLDGLRQQLNPDGFEQYPPLSENPYAKYGVGCIVPQNNSTFLNIANYTIAKMMEGYLVGDTQMTNLVNKWVGLEGIASIVSPDAIQQFFQNTINNHEQIPFSKN